MFLGKNESVHNIANLQLHLVKVPQGYFITFSVLLQSNIPTMPQKRRISKDISYRKKGRHMKYDEKKRKT
jgi:hypothetical protein